MSKNEKSGFLLYKEQYDGVSLLSMEERGELLTAIYEYQINGNVSTDLSVSASMAFQFIKGQFERDTQKYNETCAILRENGKLGGRPRKKQTEPNGSSETKRFLEKPKNHDTVTDTVTDNNITTITTITPPTPSSEGKEGKRKIKVSEIDSAEKKFDLDTYLGSDEHDLFVAVCDRMRDQCVKETSVMNEATDFIAYNEARDWKGLGGEDVIANLTKYVARWVREKAKKEDAG